jgi:ATP-dependent helicase/nuclease subunit B
MLELADGSFAYLQGRIDRIDVFKDDKTRIRVIDYKSGTKKFDPTMAYWGIQLQLLIYLSAALTQLPGASPAGFFYCRIADPMVKTESRIKDEVEKQIAKKLALAGISLSDVTVLRAQDAHHQQMITKDGKPSGRYAASMADEAGMQALVDFARSKAARLAGEAFGGDIDDSPAVHGLYNACSFCDYAAVCGFDPARKARRRLSKKTVEDLRPN